MHSVKTAAAQAEWFLGCPIWNHSKLIQKIKAPSDKAKSSLEIYSHNFNSIELNSSYYSVPTKNQIEKWRNQTPTAFKFYPKAPKDLCFYAQTELNQKILDFYLESLLNFGPQCGESFIQFSPYISPKEKHYVFKVLEALPHEFDFSIELRHPDWFNNSTLMEKLCLYLKTKNIGLVITDTPGRRDVLHMHFPTERAFVRFKGHNFHDSDKTRLKSWINFFKSHREFKRVSFFHHHSEEEHCFDSIQYMTSKLEGLTSNSLKVLEDQTLSKQIQLI